MNKKITLSIAEDHAMFRQSLIAFLNALSDFEIIHSVENGLELMKKLDQQKTEVVILDVEMPVMDGHDTIKLLNKNYPEIKVIIVSSYFDKLNILDFFSRGASAYISKKYTVEKLIDAVLSVYYNGVYTANLPTEILDSLSCTSSKKGEVKLTPTELKIVKVLFKSHSSEQASKIIGCAKRTVEWHRSNILSKTKCKSIEDLKKLFDEDLINLV